MVANIDANPRARNWLHGGDGPPCRVGDIFVVDACIVPGDWSVTRTGIGGGGLFRLCPATHAGATRYRFCHKHAKEVVRYLNRIAMTSRRLRSVFDHKRRA